MRVNVVPYDLNWPNAFKKEASNIQKILGEVVENIHHIGSTAVPNLKAKPIIDIMLEVVNLEKLDAKNELLASLGYEIMGEWGIPGRRYFRKGGENRTHHIHAFLSGNPDVKRHLAFRDYLIDHRGIANLYGELKWNLAYKYPYDIEKYSDGKDPFIKLQEKKALSWYERNQLVNVFNDNASAYDQFRPTYAREIIRDIIHLSGIQIQDKVLEIGCGTGQITIDFLRKGYELTAIEKGNKLYDIAAHKIRPYRNGHIVNQKFEDWTTTEKFRLVISAQAFHWIEIETGIQKILHLLEENGSLALLWNVDISQDTPFWQHSRPVYEKYFPNKSGMAGDSVQDYYTYLSQLDDFNVLKRLSYPWSKVYGKEQYLGLLSTFSNHMILENKIRQRFFYEIAAIIEKNQGQVEKFYNTVLIFASKKKELS